MKRVVERCPNCGVEHDHAQGGECEVCGTPLRYWCRVHGAEVGWLDEPVCPRCEAEAAEPVPRRPSSPPAAAGPPPAPRRRERPAPPVRRGRPRPERSPWPEGGSRDMTRGGVDDIRPYVVSGAGVALRLMRALFAVLRSVVVWGLLGGLAGGGFAFTQGGDPFWTALFGMMVGGGVGLFIGAIAAIRILFAPPPRGHRP